MLAKGSTRLWYRLRDLGLGINYLLFRVFFVSKPPTSAGLAIIINSFPAGKSRDFVTRLPIGEAGERSGRGYFAHLVQMLKLSPQEQLDFAFGLLNLKPPEMRAEE